MEKDLYTRLWDLIKEGKKEMDEYINRTEDKRCIIDDRVYINDCNLGVVREISGYYYDVTRDIEQFLEDASIVADCNRDAR